MKKITSAAIGIALLIVPTLVALLFFFLHSPDDDKIALLGTFTLPNGESVAFDEDTNSFLTDFLAELENNSTQSQQVFDELPQENVFTVDVRSEEISRSIRLCFQIEGYSFWVNEIGRVFKISERYADSFINSEYAKCLYEFSSLPILTVPSGDVVAPAVARWKYTAQNGTILDGASGTTTSDVVTYAATNHTGISFSIIPDVCSVKAYVNDVKVYDGTLDGLAESSLDNELIVRYEIDATWSRNAESPYFGEAKYSFYIEQTKSPVFSLDKTELVQGEFAVLSIKNITNISNLSVSVIPSIGVSFNDSAKFVSQGTDYYLLIPFSLDLEPEEYVFIFRYEGKQKSFVVQLNERTTGEQNEPELSLNDTDVSAMKSLISSVGASFSDTVYASGTFYNYENDFTIRLGFGRIRNYANGTSLQLNGVDYYRPTGENIPAINNGVVCEIGEDAILGKYVVVDHGFGLKSWYCHVGEVTVSKGKSVIKGDTVARTGMSGLTSSPGFYLITTMFDEPVCPYNLYEDNFILPN